MIELYETPEDWKEARSFTDNELIEDADCIGIVHTKYGVDFTFYKDKEGQLWYESKRVKDIEKIG